MSLNQLFYKQTLQYLRSIDVDVTHNAEIIEQSCMLQ